MKEVNSYIKENWHKTFRKGGNVGKGTIPLPYDFCVPSLDDRFIDLFYWDTYFINLGLMQDGYIELAKNNLKNMAFFINKIGYMPNASHLLYHSQPPLFTRGVFDFYEQTGDLDFLKQTLPSILKEYDFFMNERQTETGLCQYGCSVKEEDLENFYPHFSKRLNLNYERKEERNRFVKNCFAICESGWDSSYRFATELNDFASDEYIQIDLNCLLFDMEDKIEKFALILGDTPLSERFKGLKEKRRALVDKYLYDSRTGVYTDYNFKKGRFSPMVSAVGFYPFAVGINKDKERAKNLLNKLELEFGVSACAEHEKAGFLQWDYPIFWASNAYFAYQALTKVGLKEDAERVAKKYIATVERNFIETGTLWEKYNAKTGGTGATKESKVTPMLGWTAGVYKYFCAKLNIE